MVLFSPSTEKYDFMLINFYADWCRFSQQLKPVFDQAADQVKNLNLESATLVKVDCPSAASLCGNTFHITKYPTIKVVKFGMVMRKEYRGKRAVPDLVEFTKNMINVPIQSFSSSEEVQGKIQKNSVVGYFSDDSAPEFRVFKQSAATLGDGCDFFSSIRPNAESMVQYISKTGDEIGAPIDYHGDLQSSTNFYEWVLNHCVELVREITFSNGEEFTEEGLPFLLLFYAPGDEESKALFKKRVEEEVAHERFRINFLFADGKLFSHPLYHLGKSIKDLPLVAIDSFQHMYLLPKFEEINKPGRLQRFINDLYSGKLHHEFHHGPSPTEEETPSVESSDKEKRSAPPESTFKKLKPDKDRYTLLRQRDEL